MTYSSSKPNQLTVFIKDSSNSDTIFHTQKDTDVWMQGSGNVLSHNTFEIFIQASLGDGLASVKLDDITLEDCDSGEPIQDGQTDRRTDGRTDGRTDRGIDGRTEG